MPQSKRRYTLSSQDKLNTLQLLIIDEVSMHGGIKFATTVPQTSSATEGQGDEATFGDVSILAVEDPFQQQIFNLPW